MARKPAKKATSTESARKSAKTPSKKNVRYGVVGLGWFAQTAILPAFEHATKNSELVALFSDDPAKLAKIGKKHRIDPGLRLRPL